jgi:lauroyl/myristoyl acyltransferase
VSRKIYNARRLTAFATLDFILGGLPRGITYVVMAISGWIVATIFPGRIAGLYDNLRHVFPDYTNAQLVDLMQRNAKNYGKFWVDLFKIPRYSAEKRATLGRIEGEEHLDEIIARGKGCIVISIHMGGWEGAAAVWSSTKQVKTALIAEVLEPPALWRRVRALREKNGLELIPLASTAPRDIIRRLRENQIVAGAIDRDLLGTGRPFKFFDGVIKVPTGMVQVAQHTGAGIIPVLSLRAPDDSYRFIGKAPIYVGEGEEAIDEAMRQLLATFEEGIRANPDQWHVMESIWKPELQQAYAGAQAATPAKAVVEVGRG